MSNMSIGGTSNQSIRTERVERPVSADSNTAQQPSAEVSAIDSVREMKIAEQQGEHVAVSDEQLIRAIDRAIKAMQGATTTLDFSVHEKTKQIMVKVLDRDTGEVIREIPPEKTLDFVAKMWEMAGILIDEKR